MRLRGRFLPLPPAPVSLCIRRGRAVSSARPQHHRTAAPTRVFRGGDPPRNGEPVRPAGSLRLNPLEGREGEGGHNGEGRSRTDARASLLRAPPTPRPPRLLPPPLLHRALQSSFFGGSSLRGAATSRPRALPALVPLCSVPRFRGRPRGWLCSSGLQSPGRERTAGSLLWSRVRAHCLGVRLRRHLGSSLKAGYRLHP
ncbi:hypothetical protein NDU88_006601 [Pleurodeles waltl]|uniref:Uncharacterized protein n=1 Tax=Pleurodeles waltl TaxID=8319 RepID=A0AAV7NQP1_PLEWA|nr:hypothetical protein NDU88_006601 [Pleurodeles waltl]